MPHGWRSSLTTRIVGIILLTQAALLPALYISLDRIAWRGNSELFASMARGYLGRRAGELSSGQVSLDDSSLRPFVDRIVSSGFVAYAEVRLPGTVVRSHSEAPTPLPADDAGDVIDPGDDHIYYSAQRWQQGAVIGTLLLGFDESFMHSRISSARMLLAASLMGFFVLVMVAGVLLARHLIRPIDRLRAAADRVAAGNLSQSLDTTTGIREIENLSHDLERMRRSRDAMAARVHQKQRLETVGTLAGGISHEFNNILLPIILFLESATDALPPEHPAHAPVARALAAAGRARDIVAKLLVFSRHGGSAAVDPTPIGTAVDEALRLFGRICPSYITVHAELDGSADPVRVDGGQIVQIVMNLCTNAYQAIPPSGGSIRVGLGNVVVDGSGMVELTVQDTGSGMDASTLSRIFEPFFTTREVGRGSGLGLAVVHGIVADLHGTIVAESRLGEGTLIRIRLPSARPEGN